MNSSVRTAILKGAGESANVGDVMMQHIAENLIKSHGFAKIHKVGHSWKPAKLHSFYRGHFAASLMKSLRFAKIHRVRHAIDAIFVLGSIQYSDAWTTPTLLQRLENSINFHRRFPKARVIFLPATWGTFESSHADALARLVTGTKVLVRDKFSVDNINGLLGSPIADYCPDLAFLYPTASADLAQPFLERTFKDPTTPLMGIIPNHRCIQKGVTPLQRPEDYINFLARSKDWAVSQGFNVLGISHMLNTDRDLGLMRDLDIKCLPINNVNLIRAIIASLTVCISSRYHGLVSCLSHGVPVLALGWHHKYRNLMDDMELGAHHLSVVDLPQDPSPLLNNLLGSHGEVHNKIVYKVTTAQRIIRTAIESLNTNLR